MSNNDLISIFKSLAPRTIGFDSLMKDFERLSDPKNFPTFPPYNIVKKSDDNYVVELAVAGFPKSSIDITLDGGTLKVKGSLESSNEEDNFIFKGITGRAFERSFKLADYVEVKNAELINGILKVTLEKMVPDEKKPRKIEISEDGSSEKKSDPQLLEG